MAHGPLVLSASPCATSLLPFPKPQLLIMTTFRGLSFGSFARFLSEYDFLSTDCISYEKFTLRNACTVSIRNNLIKISCSIYATATVPYPTQLKFLFKQIHNVSLSLFFCCSIMAFSSSITKTNLSTESSSCMQLATIHIHVLNSFHIQSGTLK